MRIVGRLSDRLLQSFVPKVDASAIYIWQWMCQTSNTQCKALGKKVYCYCHDGSGHCTTCQPWDGVTCCSL